MTEGFCQNPLEKWFGRQRSLGSRKDNPSMADFGYNNNAITNHKNSNQSLRVMLLLREQTSHFHVENLKENESLNVNLE